MPEMRISLVVPVRDEEATICELVDGISAQTRPPDEVILVDGGSTDRTVALLKDVAERDPRYRVVEAGSATPGRGRNLGMASASNPWIALTDAGIRLEPDWLERLAAQLKRDPTLDVVYGNFQPVTDTFFERCAALAYASTVQERPGGRMRGPFIASSLTRKSVWEAVGGFPDLRAAEDLIYMERVEAGGFRIGWASDAMVHWNLRPTFSTTFRKFVLYSKHNVLAGRQRFWHYGLARQYVLVIPIAALASLHSPWWLLALPAAGMLRTAKSIWIRREERGLIWALNPVQFAAVGTIIAGIDLATTVGWIQAVRQRRVQPD